MSLNIFVISCAVAIGKILVLYGHLFCNQSICCTAENQVFFAATQHILFFEINSNT